MQAEDGRRDRSTSSGLGDGYKRKTYAYQGLGHELGLEAMEALKRYPLVKLSQI